MRGTKQDKLFARQLFRLSLENGRLSSERVSGVLQYLEKTRPARLSAVLKAYRTYVAAEIARGQALVEHSGPISDATLQGIAASFSRAYQRPITPAAQPNPELLGGLRIRVGDDVYETSLAGQLATLSVS